MKESDIIHESPDNRYWVTRQVSRNEKIAPLDSVYFEVFKTGLTHSTSTGYVTANVERAKLTCDNMVRVSSAEYRKHERAITKAEKSIRRNVR